MDGRAVRHFLAAFDAGTFAAAATRLGLTQQAVSKSILRLEAELGVRLFERDGRRLRPTSYADMLIPHARTIVAEADRFRADLSDELGGHRGRLRIGVGPSASDMLARATSAMLATGTGASFRVLAGIQERMASDLILGELDLFVALRQADLAEPLIREEELGPVRYIVVAGVRHPLAGRPRLAFGDLARERWLVGVDLGAVEKDIDASFRAARAPRLKTEIETTSVLFTQSLLDDGRHLAILPEMLVARDIRAGRLTAIDVDTSAWTRPMIVATRARGAKSRPVALLLDHLRHAFAAELSSLASA